MTRNRFTEQGNHKKGTHSEGLMVLETGCQKSAARLPPGIRVGCKVLHGCPRRLAKDLPRCGSGRPRSRSHGVFIVRIIARLIPLAGTPLSIRRRTSGPAIAPLPRSPSPAVRMGAALSHHQARRRGSQRRGDDVRPRGLKDAQRSYDVLLRWPCCLGVTLAGLDPVVVQLPLLVCVPVYHQGPARRAEVPELFFRVRGLGLVGVTVLEGVTPERLQNRPRGRALLGASLITPLHARDVRDGDLADLHGPCAHGSHFLCWFFSSVPALFCGGSRFKCRWFRPGCVGVCSGSV